MSDNLVQSNIQIQLLVLLSWTDFVDIVFKMSKTM